MENNQNIIQIIKNAAALNKASKPLSIMLEGKTIQPVLLFLPDTESWLKRWADGLAYLNGQGIYPFNVPGIHGERWGIKGTKIYLRDGRPEEKHYIGDGQVAGCLSHYILYNVMAALDSEYFMILEDDCRFNEGWKEKLENALQNLPADFDFLFVGSGCAEDKQPEPVGKGLFYFPKRKNKPGWYPQTSHCYIVAKKAVPVLLATQRSTADPTDVQVLYEAFPWLNVYAILPRLAEQLNKQIPC